MSSWFYWWYIIIAVFVAGSNGGISYSGSARATGFDIGIDAGIGLGGLDRGKNNTEFGFLILYFYLQATSYFWFFATLFHFFWEYFGFRTALYHM